MKGLKRVSKGSASTYGELSMTQWWIVPSCRLTTACRGSSTSSSADRCLSFDAPFFDLGPMVRGWFVVSCRRDAVVFSSETWVESNRRDMHDSEFGMCGLSGRGGCPPYARPVTTSTPVPAIKLLHPPRPLGPPVTV